MVVDLLDALSPGDWLCRYQVLFKLHLVVLVQTIYSKPGTFLLSSDATVLLILHILRVANTSNCVVLGP